MRLLIEHAADVRAIAAQALAAPISLDDADGVRVLLEVGADLGQYRDDDNRPARVVQAAIDAGCGLELIELLPARGADPGEVGDGSRSACATATVSGRGDLRELLKRYGARDGKRRAANPAPDWVQTVCILLDAGAVTSQISLDPGEPFQPDPEVAELLRARGIGRYRSAAASPGGSGTAATSPP